MVSHASQRVIVVLNSHIVQGRGKRIPDEETDTLQEENVCGSYSIQTTRYFTAFLFICYNYIAINVGVDIIYILRGRKKMYDLIV